jgi:hypothetical protein
MLTKSKAHWKFGLYDLIFVYLAWFQTAGPYFSNFCAQPVYQKSKGCLIVIFSCSKNIGIFFTNLYKKISPNVLQNYMHAALSKRRELPPFETAVKGIFYVKLGWR